MKYIQFTLSLSLLLLSLSCEKDIAYNGDTLTNFMVVNAMISSDSLIQCKLTRSNTLLESDEIKAVPDAQLNIYKDGTLLETLEHGTDGNYFSALGFVGQVGSVYAIECSHSEYATIKATSKVLEPVKAEIISMEEGESSNNNYYSGEYTNDVLKFKVQINDKKGSNFYRLMVYVPSIDYDHETGISSINKEGDKIGVRIFSKDPVLNGNKVVTESDMEDIPYNEYMVFDDFLFDGESYILHFEIDNATMWFENEDDKKQFIEGIEVDVQHLSEGLYKNFVTVTASNYYGDSPFSEPVQVYSNIEGGAGIFGTVSSNILKYEK